MATITPTKVYRRHNCARGHRMWNAFARCVWPRAVWVNGEGPWASVAYCGGTTVMLFTTLVNATDAKGSIDAYGCGGRCGGRHEVVRLEREIDEEAAFQRARRYLEPLGREVGR